MPEVRCVGCGVGIDIDPDSLPYIGELTCHDCGVGMNVKISEKDGALVERRMPSLKDINSIRRKLSVNEFLSLYEACLSLGANAYTASEIMSLRTLEALLRRVYQTNETFGKLLQRLQNDKDLSELEGILAYFKKERDKVAHPDKLSGKLDAESTLSMTIRLIKEIISKKKM